MNPLPRPRKTGREIMTNGRARNRTARMSLFRSPACAAMAPMTLSSSRLRGKIRNRDRERQWPTGAKAAIPAHSNCVRRYPPIWRTSRMSRLCSSRSTGRHSANSCNAVQESRYFQEQQFVTLPRRVSGVVASVGRGARAGTDGYRRLYELRFLDYAP